MQHAIAVKMLIFALSLFCATLVQAGGMPLPQQLTAHSYAWIGPYGPPTRENQGFRMNLGFVVGSDAVAVIDSGYGDDMAEAMLAEIRRLTDRPVRYVISTNSQPHRILGNAMFRKHGAVIIAGEGAVSRIKSQGEALAARAEDVLGLATGSIQVPGVPDRTISDVTMLDLGGITLKVTQLGKAHTPGSLAVEVVEDKVVYAGDVLYRGRLLSVLSYSRIDGWITAFEKLRAYKDVLFVPGHGLPGPLSDFEHSTYQYLTTLKTHMDAAVDQGLDLQDAIHSLDQSPWRGLADFEMLAGPNAHRTFLEREAAAFE